MRHMRSIRKLFLAFLVVPASLSFAQNGEATWKQYSYPDDGFTISFPDAPRIHPDTVGDQTTGYSVIVYPDHALTVLVKREVPNCKWLIEQLRESSRIGFGHFHGVIVKELAFGVEYEFPAGASQVNHRRYFCGNGRMYALAVARERDEPLSPSAVKILDSFRIVAANPKHD